jgi:hypothetical protein
MKFINLNYKAYTLVFSSILHVATRQEDNLIPKNDYI